MRPFHGQIYGNQFGNMKMYEFYSARGEFLKQVATNYIMRMYREISDLQLNTITICSISDSLRTGTRFKQSAQLIHLLVVA